MTTVGRFELLHQIGQGGMAVVHLARQIDLDRLVALKELRVLHAPSDVSMAQRFLREARIAGSLTDSNIVHVYEHFEHDGTAFIAMEYLKNGSLRPLAPQLTLAQAVGVLRDVLSALEQAHKLNIVHRDLKPENLLISDEGDIKVTDFGIAKALTSTATGLTATGTTMGTPTYMAPEQGMAQELGPCTDLYSLGVIAYELVVGRVPFEQTDSPLSVLVRHVTEDIPPAYTVKPEIDRPLSDWIERLLVRDPERRTQTATEAWEQLEEIALRLMGARWQRAAVLPTLQLSPAAAGDMAQTVAPSDGYVSYRPFVREKPDSSPSVAGVDRPIDHRVDAEPSPEPQPVAAGTQSGASQELGHEQPMVWPDDRPMVRASHGHEVARPAPAGRLRVGRIAAIGIAKVESAAGSKRGKLATAAAKDAGVKAWSVARSVLRAVVLVTWAVLSVIVGLVWASGTGPVVPSLILGCLLFVLVVLLRLLRTGP